MSFTPEQQKAIEETKASLEARRRFTPEQQAAIADATMRAKELGAITRFGQGSALPIAKAADTLLGKPAGVIGRALGLDAPGEPVQSLFASQGMIPQSGQPEGMAGAMGDFVGMAALTAPAMLGPVMSAGGAAIRQVPSALAPRAQSTVGRIGEQMAESAIRKPGAFAASETVAAAGAGAGGYIAAERFPDSVAAQATAEIIGGFTPAAAMGALKTAPGAISAATGLAATGNPLAAFAAPVVASVRRMVMAKTPTGAHARAKARFDRALPDPQTDVLKLDRDDILPHSRLTPAQKVGEPQMLSLEKSVMESTPELSAARQVQFADENAFLRRSLRDVGGDADPGQARDYLQSLLDTRLRIAATKADDAIANLSPKGTAEDANRLARREIDNALYAARNQENDLYAAIAPDTTVDVIRASTRMAELKSKMGQAQHTDIPAIARKFLDPESPSYFGDETSMKEIRGLQSKLREVARFARGQDQYNKARIADDLANSLTDDVALANVPDDQRKALEIAIGFSRDLNDRFTRGPVGRLLGYESSGAASTPSGLTLETTAGARGARAAVETDALLESVRRSGNEPALRGHIEDFLKDKFRQQTMLGRDVDPKKVETFLRQNDGVLSRFPELKRQMEHAGKTGEALVSAQRLSDPEISRAAIFLKAEPGKEFTRVIATGNPGKAVKELVTLAKKDPTGVALKGVKASAIQHLWKSAHTNPPDINEQPFLSGSKLKEALDTPKMQQALQSLFEPDELKRLKAIVTEAQLLDRARHAEKAGEGVLGDRPSQVTTAMAGIFGAFVGRHMNTGTIQVPGKMATFFTKLVEYFVSDPGTRLVIDAVQDEKLFRALTMELTPGAVQKEKFVRKQLHGWAAGVLANYGETGETDQNVTDQE